MKPSTHKQLCLLKELARAKAMFQQRAIMLAMGINPSDANVTINDDENARSKNG